MTPKEILLKSTDSTYVPAYIYVPGTLPSPCGYGCWDLNLLLFTLQLHYVKMIQDDFQRIFALMLH